MTTVGFHPAVELLTSSVGGSIHIIKFIDLDFFHLFVQKNIRRLKNFKGLSLEFCYLCSENTEEEVLLVHISKPELHFHGGEANVEHVFNLLNQIPYQKEVEIKETLSKKWMTAYREAHADESINYLLSIRERALSNDLSLMNNEDHFEIEGYDFLRPVKIMLMGPPNAGKSTFFNYLVGEQRALISEIAGTTRDTLTATLQFSGYEVELIDTAGLRDNALNEGQSSEYDSIQGKSEQLVQSISEQTDIYCLFNTEEIPKWIPESKVLHLKSKSDLDPKAHPSAISFSIHQNTGCEEVIEAISKKVTFIKKRTLSTRFFKR